MTKYAQPIIQQGLAKASPLIQTLGFQVQIVFILLLVVLGVLNIKATLTVSRSTIYDSTQKWFQLMLIWLFPIVGALLVIIISGEFKGNSVNTSFNSTLDIGYSGDSFVEHQHHENRAGDLSGGSDY